MSSTAFLITGILIILVGVLILIRILFADTAGLKARLAALEARVVDDGR